MIGNVKKLTQTRWFEVIFLALISGFTYLPRIGELTYYRDDWYFLYDALVFGPKALIEVALHTRPIRGPLYALYFSWFGLNPFPYHVVMYLTRLLGGIGALWLFNLIWPKRHRANFFMAVLFVLFPGFLWWVAGFEFQPYVLSVGLQAFSIAFTLKAIASESMPKRLGWTVAALFSGWAYLALVEYAIGMEAFRLICVYLYIRRRNAQSTFIASVLQTLKTSGPHLLVPVVFLVWYQFLFDNWRKAQDAGTQLGALFSSPTTMLWRTIDVVRSFLNVSLFAWIIPFYQNFYGNRLKDIVTGSVFAVFVLVLIYLANRYLTTSSSDEEEPVVSQYTWQREMLWVGLLGTLGGVLPVVLANRLVTFERISQYTLPASLAGVIFLGGLIYSVFPKNIRVMLFSGLIGLAVLSHHGLAAQAVNEEATISDFWKQVVWRAPDIKSGTTLVIVYPDINYLDGNDVAWGPANFIYYPDKQKQMPVVVPLPASRLEPDSILQIINGNKSFEQTDLVIKFIQTETNYKNQLIMTQPSQDSCVHALDPRWPDLSTSELPFIHAAYQNSKIENIVTDAKAHELPVYGFGPALPQEWCYYYQKADLARQQGNWEEVARLGNEAQKLELHPNDQIEWMPFLQAYAFLGNKKQVNGISTRINTEPYYRQLACKNLNAMADHGYPLTPDMQSQVDELFCQ
ncbi:MAG: hypothetical protein IPP66_09970 [Anaerolineales bacterium]|nr:hypothetical protein [Anaerolineales bacterium]